MSQYVINPCNYIEVKYCEYSTIFDIKTWHLAPNSEMVGITQSISTVVIESVILWKA